MKKIKLARPLTSASVLAKPRSDAEIEKLFESARPDGGKEVETTSVDSKEWQPADGTRENPFLIEPAKPTPRQEFLRELIPVDWNCAGWVAQIALKMKGPDERPSSEDFRVAYGILRDAYDFIRPARSGLPPEGKYLDRRMTFIPTEKTDELRELLRHIQTGTDHGDYIGGDKIKEHLDSTYPQWKRELLSSSAKPGRSGGKTTYGIPIYAAVDALRELEKPTHTRTWSDRAYRWVEDFLQKNNRSEKRVYPGE